MSDTDHKMIEVNYNDLEPGKRYYIMAKRDHGDPFTKKKIGTFLNNKIKNEHVTYSNFDNVTGVHSSQKHLKPKTLQALSFRDPGHLGLNRRTIAFYQVSKDEIKEINERRSTEEALKSITNNPHFIWDFTWDSKEVFDPKNARRRRPTEKGGKRKSRKSRKSKK